MPFVPEPAAPASSWARARRLAGRVLLVLLLAAALDAAFGWLTFYIATLNHGRGGLNPEWMTTASAFLLTYLGLRLFSVVWLVRRNGYVQGAAAVVSLLLLGLLMLLLRS